VSETLDQQLEREAEKAAQSRHYATLGVDHASQPAGKGLAAQTSPPHPKHGDRGPGDDDTRGLPIFIRFEHLKRAGITSSWPQPMNLIRNYDFPSGTWIGKHSRAWRVTEVLNWLETRPAAPATTRPRRKRAIEATEDTQKRKPRAHKPRDQLGF
jgi:predicted DNA-binding transcriptional regulator AlpA